MGFLSYRLPLRQVVRSLLLDVRLRVDSVLAGKFLGNRVLDFDRLHGFGQVGERIVPALL